MDTKNNKWPAFETDEQAAEYWDTHSPLDFIAEPKAHKLIPLPRKDKLISLRLDSSSLRRLEGIANEIGIGVTTFARKILLEAIKKNDQTLILDSHDELASHKTPCTTVGLATIDDSSVASVAKARILLRAGQTNALKGDWQGALAQLECARTLISDQNHEYIKYEIQMVWSTIQNISIMPLIVMAEKAVENWDYDKAQTAFEQISTICEKSGLPLDYEDLHTRVLALARTTCTAAAMWKGNVDRKLDRCAIGIGILLSNDEFKKPWISDPLHLPLNIAHISGIRENILQ
ncbi:MAG: CopG family antitoxin [Chloroflexi bacterium]|nr:CopG family antitoxin [Chloroflexota bacterium]